MLQAVIDIESHLTGTPVRDIGVFTSSALSVALQIAAIATFGMLVFGGINWLISSGDPEKLKKAQDMITNAIIGLVIVACSWAIFLLIEYFLGFKISK